MWSVADVRSAARVAVRRRTMVGKNQASGARFVARAFFYLAPAVASLCIYSPGRAFSQTPGSQINPGGIDQELRRQEQQFDRRTQPSKQQGPAVIAPKQEQSPFLKPGGPKFRLKGVRINGSYFLSREEISAITSKYIGKDVDFSALQAIIAAIVELYQKKGVVTGIATLPPQKIENGIVRIQLTEGRLGKLSVTGNVQTLTPYILARIRLPKPGEVVDVPAITRDVVWFNRTNDVQVRVLLRPGSTLGLTDIELAVTEPPINTLQIFADNQGVSSTGVNQFGTYYRRHGIAGFDDRFTFYGTKSQGNINGSLSYTVPFNVWGGRVGLSYTQGKIKITNGPYETLDVNGQSKLGSVTLSQPVLADSEWLIAATGAYTVGYTQSDILGITTVEDLSWKKTGGFTVSNYGSFYTITVSPVVNAIHSYSRVTQIDRDFPTYTGNFSGLFKLPAEVSVSVLGSWQYTWEHLLPGDQLFQVGGPTTVRGFPTNLVAGDSGYFFNVELHRDLSTFVKGLDIYAFHDRGEVWSTSPRDVVLRSFGVGMSWTVAPPLVLEASLGIPTEELTADQPHHQAYFRAIFRPLMLFQ